MTTMKNTLSRCLLCAALAAAPTASADPSATSWLRGKQATMSAVSHWSDPRKRETSVLALWRAWGDWDRIAADSVGPKVWGELEEAHRARLATLLADVAALNWLRRARTSDFSVTYVREESVRDRRVVVTRVTAGGESADVRWVLAPSGEEFRLVDVVTEGASLVSTQRSSFARVMERGGVNRLFTRLERKREDLRAEVAR
ncbi:MAG: hypothetical protein EBR40_03110 [Proteobacteria bacterium]|nr:hypothetical protein [Pseudomonadota bacterium]